MDEQPVPPARWHGLRWLPERPYVNPAPVRLFVGCAWPPERVAVEGLPSAELFLVGWPDAERAARSGAHVVAVRVERGAAVDLTLAAGHLPDELRHLAGVPGAYLLPGGWLDGTRLVEGYRVDGAGEVTSAGAVPAIPLTLRCTGARHGTDGLPDDVVRWPRLARTAYAVVSGPPVTDFLPIHTRRPPVRPGHRLVRFRVEPGYAIDVAATADRLTPLAPVRSRLPDLRASGVELILPRRAFGQVPITRVFEPNGRGWRRFG
ncbi:hypothetical protein RB614_14470 [Phytohabitans sp. ZYX-F-186]|uniref:Acetoacetate decarboxylase n=1 Tax=Phytohabitans maris TaxID=3071409 RepID=A0ABU0ZHG2_9ACTN|nr:hypothetical protein [Phytohabitans sp. ZYX-F-186]MDQ7905720.1 hypothetical protein [Phytohabitans sp. ZYX-F-186]